MGSIWYINDPCEWEALKTIGVSKVDENAPYFMQSKAYAIKNIVTYL